MRMLKLLKELLFPKFCLSCKKFGLYICARCRSNLTPFNREICFYCEKDSLEGETHEHCQQGGVDRFITVFQYNPTLKKIIASIKYRLVSDAFGEFFEYIESGKKLPFLSSKFQNDQILIQPIPLHPNRLKQRGFNQSELIARWLAKKLNAKVTNTLDRVKETKAQAQLSKTERITNAQNAFRLKKGVDLAGSSLILVDDVVTTGSTVHAAAAALKAAGASKITVFSIAKDLELAFSNL